MARSQSNTVWKVLGAGAAVIVGGVAFGLLFGSIRDTRPAVQPASPAVSSTLTPPPAAPPSGIHPRTTNGNYTAPGAPRISIQEESQPILRRTAPPTPPPDSEAAQEAAPTPVPETAPAGTAQTTAPDTGTAPPPATSNSSGGGASGGSVSSPAALPPAAPPPPVDPDFEHVNSPAKASPGTSDPEAGQQGGSPGKAQSGDASGGKVQFRVQTGAFSDESSARTAADTLRSQGYTPSTRSERSGDHLVYKVQVGAYRSKTGANKAADDLQKKGYPAYISPINP